MATMTIAVHLPVRQAAGRLARRDADSVADARFNLRRMGAA